LKCAHLLCASCVVDYDQKEDGIMSVICGVCKSVQPVEETYLNKEDTLEQLEVQCVCDIRLALRELKEHARHCYAQFSNRAAGPFQNDSSSADIPNALNRLEEKMAALIDSQAKSMDDLQAKSEDLVARSEQLFEMSDDVKGICEVLTQTVRENQSLLNSEANKVETSLKIISRVEDAVTCVDLYGRMIMNSVIPNCTTISPIIKFEGIGETIKSFESDYENDVSVAESFFCGGHLWEMVVLLMATYKREDKANPHVSICLGKDESPTCPHSYLCVGIRLRNKQTESMKGCLPPMKKRLTISSPQTTKRSKPLETFKDGGLTAEAFDPLNKKNDRAWINYLTLAELKAIQSKEGSVLKLQMELEEIA